MWWWAAARSGWWCPQTSSLPPRTWWSRRWRSQWCSPTTRSPWLLVSASQRVTVRVGSSWERQESATSVQSKSLLERWGNIMSVSSLLILMREVFRLFCRSLQCCMFVCFIRYLMLRPHCLSPLPHCVCSLAHNTNRTAPSFTQTSERKIWKRHSLFLSLSSPQSPVSLLHFSHHLWFIPAVCF